MGSFDTDIEAIHDLKSHSASKARVLDKDRLYDLYIHGYDIRN